LLEGGIGLFVARVVGAVQDDDEDDTENVFTAISK
jgi:hypothetical protein